MNKAARKAAEKPKDPKDAESYIEEIQETKAPEPKKFKRIAIEESDEESGEEDQEEAVSQPKI
jgi:hypothetical protein